MKAEDVAAKMAAFLARRLNQEAEIAQLQGCTEVAKVLGSISYVLHCLSRRLDDKGWEGLNAK